MKLLAIFVSLVISTSAFASTIYYEGSEKTVTKTSLAPMERTLYVFTDSGKCKFNTESLAMLHLDILALTKAISQDNVSIRAQKNTDGFCDLLLVEFVK
jgi:hypothetical protein